MFGPRIPNVAKIKSEEPRIDVVRRTFDFVLPICLKAEQSVTFFSRMEIFFVEEHFLKGGLASHFFEKSLEYKLNFDTKKIVSINPKFKFMKGLGEKEEGLIKLGLDKKNIINHITANLN